MKHIPLTQGKFAIVDDEDYDYLMQWKWYARKSRNTYYATRRGRQIKGEHWQMHRMILDAKPEQLTDHIECNGLDNRKSNLRMCTTRENLCNQQKTSKATSSIYKGVSWQKRMKKWESYIRHKGRRIHLGFYIRERNAARAYNTKARELFGVFAKPNF